MEKILILPLLISIFSVLFITPHWIKRIKKAGITGKDMHKLDKREIAEIGGIPVLLSFILGVLLYIFLETFYFNHPENLIKIFALISSMLIIGLIGLIDDILGWKIGLNKKSRLILLVFSAIPLIVINAGHSTMMGINFGILYPLVLIPLGIVGASATFNFLAGYNGLEASQGILILSALSLVTYLTGNSWLSLICLIMVFCLIGFLIYNKVPALIFPGDVLTYSVGALIAITAILGNIEKIAIIFFIPYIIEVGLKSRGKLEKQSFGKLNEKGYLEMPYEKIYALEHFAIKILKKIKPSKNVKEIEVVLFINAIQLFFILIGFLVMIL